MYGTPTKGDVTYRDLRGTDEFYMWSDVWNQFIARHMRFVRCDECGEQYNDEWYTESMGRDGEMLVCECGQQFSQVMD